MNKYDPLYNYLSKQTNQTLLLSFCEIEGILGFELPSSAADHTQWWSNSGTKQHPHCKAWLDAGYKSVDIQRSRLKRQMTFEKY